MTNDTRTPEEIERQIKHERAGLTDTLDDLQDKFSVETIARQVTDQFREHGGDIGRSVSDAVKSNPIALTLTGVGLAWLMMGDRSSGRDRSYSRPGYGDTRAYDDQYDDDRFDRDKVSRSTPSRGRAGTSRTEAGMVDLRSNTTSRQPESYYSESAGAHLEIPSWSRTSDDDDQAGIGSKVSNAASGVAGTVRDAGSRTGDKVKDAASAVTDAGQTAVKGARELASSASDRAKALRSRLAEGTEHFPEHVRDRVVAARESAIQARDNAVLHARQGRGYAVDIFEEQPLIAGALAVAFGAALAAALPRSQMEDDYFGSQSDKLMDEAERIFAEEKQKIGSVAKSATEEAKKIVSEVKDGADEAAAADTAADAVVNKAKSAGKRVADAAKTEAKKQDLGNSKKS